MAGRRLSLHVSALSDYEYEFYTSCLLDLTQDGESPLTQDNFADNTIGVREVRAWMRGRFPDVKLSDVDAILKYFAPNLAQSDTMDAGQFFAALRLLIHVDGGSTLDRGLAFVQAEPPAHSRSRSASPSKVPPHRAVSAPSSSPKRSQPPLPPPPAPRSHLQVQPRARAASNNNPFLTSTPTSSSSALPPLPPRKLHLPPPPPPHRTTPHVTTPLMQQSLQASKVGSALKQAEKMLEKERIMEVLKSSTPTLNRRSTSPTKVHSGIPHSVSSSSSEKEAPPLPRRRGTGQSSYSPPQSATSWEQVATASLPTKRPPPPPKSAKPKPPPVPPKPILSSPEHPTVDLPPPTHPDRRRPSVSTASSSHQSARSPTHSHSRSMGSPSSDTPSFEAVYGKDLTPSRVTRSKSLHASPTSQDTNTTPATAPASPLSRLKGRRRPESVGFSPSRHISLLALRDRASEDADDVTSHSNPESHIARTLEKLTKARYKAEAGLSRRGFVPEGRDGLVRGEEESNGYDRLHSALDSEASSDNEDLKRRPPVRINERWGPL